MEIYQVLLREYGPQGWWPVGGFYFPKDESPFEIAAGAILTQNATWKNAERALDNLRKRGLLSPEALGKIKPSVLAEIIRPSGYYNQKALRLKELSRFFKNRIDAEHVPGRNSLLGVSGIGPETADSILLYAFHIPVFVVDGYTRRIFTRLGVFSGKESYSTVQECFMGVLPRDVKIYNEYHALIVKHGKEVCRTAPLCDRCVLKLEKICRFTVA
jgi:endonuclease-3 related protein